MTHIDTYWPLTVFSAPHSSISAVCSWWRRCRTRGALNANICELASPSEPPSPLSRLQNATWTRRRRLRRPPLMLKCRRLESSASARCADGGACVSSVREGCAWITCGVRVRSRWIEVNWFLENLYYIRISIINVLLPLFCL